MNLRKSARFCGSEIASSYCGSFVLSLLPERIPVVFAHVADLLLDRLDVRLLHPEGDGAVQEERGEHLAVNVLGVLPFVVPTGIKGAEP